MSKPTRLTKTRHNNFGKSGVQKGRNRMSKYAIRRSLDRNSEREMIDELKRNL